MWASDLGSADLEEDPEDAEAKEKMQVYCPSLWQLTERSVASSVHQAPVTPQTFPHQQHLSVLIRASNES